MFFADSISFAPAPLTISNPLDANPVIPPMNPLREAPSPANAFVDPFNIPPLPRSPVSLPPIPLIPPNSEVTANISPAILNPAKSKRTEPIPRTIEPIPLSSLNNVLIPLKKPPSGPKKAS